MRVTITLTLKLTLLGQCPDEEMVLSWLPGQRKELDHVTNRRLTMLSDVSDDIKRDAIPLRMILEQKRDGRRKGRLILQGFREPTEGAGSSDRAGSPDRLIFSLIAMFRRRQHSSAPPSAGLRCTVVLASYVTWQWRCRADSVSCSVLVSAPHASTSSL